MKLTNAHRREIANAIVDNKYKSSLASALSARAAAGDTWHETTFPQHTYAHVNPELLCYESDMRAYCSALGDDSNDAIRVYFTTRRCVPPAWWKEFDAAKTFEWKKYVVANDAVLHIERAITQAYTEVKAILAGFNTPKQAQKAWPEIEPFLPRETPRGTRIALIPAGLNERLGLPPETAP